MISPDLCPHSLPAYIPIGAVVRGDVVCEDCENEDAMKPAHYCLLVVLLALIWVPLVLLIAGVFW